MSWKGCPCELGSFGLLGLEEYPSCTLDGQFLREASSTTQGIWLYLYLCQYSALHSVPGCLERIWQLAQDGRESKFCRCDRRHGYVDHRHLNYHLLHAGIL